MLKSLREKAVYTAPFQSTLNTEIQKHSNERIFYFLIGVELDVIFSLLNSGGTEMILAVCFILALVQIQFVMAKLQRSRYKSYRMVTSTGTLGSLLLQMCLFLASIWELSFSLSYLHNHLKQSNISPGVPCSDVDEVVSDEVLNKRVGKHAHIKPWICNKHYHLSILKSLREAFSLQSCSL